MSSGIEGHSGSRPAKKSGKSSRGSDGEKGFTYRNRKKIGAAVAALLLVGGTAETVRAVWGPQPLSKDQLAEVAAIDSMRDSKVCLPLLNAMVQLPEKVKVLDYPTKDSKVVSTVAAGNYGMLRRPAVYTDPATNTQYWLVIGKQSDNLNHAESRDLGKRWDWIDGTAVLNAIHTAKDNTGYAKFDLGKPTGAQACGVNLAGEITGPGDVVIAGSPDAAEVSVMHTIPTEIVKYLTDIK
jgi:hypothetical protein